MKSGLICLFIIICSFLQAQEDSLLLMEIDSINYTDSTLVKSLSSDSLAKGDSIADSLKTNANIPAPTVPVSKSAVESVVEYDAQDSIQIDNMNRIIYLYGNAVVTYEDIKLEAPFMEIYMNSNELLAYGKEDSLGNYIKPLFTDPTSSFSANEIRYNFETKKGKIKQVVTEENGGFINGKQVKKLEDNTIYIKNGSFATCDCPDPCFEFRSTKMKVIPSDKIVSGPSMLFIEGIPTPFVLPFAIFPNNPKKTSGIIIPAFGGRNATYGASFQRGGYFWAINDYVNLELLGDIYSQGSFGLHALSNYKKRYRRTGNVTLDFLQWTSGDRAITSEFNSRYDFKLRWNHRQDPKAKPNGTFSAAVNFGTSGYNQNDLTTQMTNQRLQAQTNSNITYSFRVPKSPFSGSVATTHSQNNLTGDMTISLPNFSLNMSRIYLRNPKKVVGKPKWYQNFNLSYSARGQNTTKTNDSLLTPETIDQFFGDFDKGVRHSIPIQGNFKTKYFNITPSFSFNSFWYLDYQERDSIQQEYTELNGFKTGNDFNMSVNFRTVLYGDYVPVLGKKRRIEKIRHVMTPSVGFRYVPDFTAENWRNFSGYREAYDTLSNTFDYNIFTGNIVGAPTRGQSGALTFSLNNTVQMKVKTPKDTVNTTKKVSIFDRLSVNSNYNFFADSLNLAVFNVSGNTTVVKGLTLNFSALFDPYQVDEDFKRINQFQWDNEEGGIVRLTRANAAVRWRLEGKKDREDQGKILQKVFREDWLYYQNNPELFIDFNIPWSLSLSYNLNFRQRVVDEELVLEETQTFNFSGDVRVSEGWKVGYSSGYDFISKNITSNTRFSVNRALRCWDMSLVWVPFGRSANYLLTIQARPAMFKDLKTERRRTSADYGNL